MLTSIITQAGMEKPQINFDKIVVKHEDNALIKH